MSLGSKPNRAGKRTLEPRRPRRVSPAARGHAASRFLLPLFPQGQSRQGLALQKLKCNYENKKQN
jgi:hypothetical protein